MNREEQLKQVIDQYLAASPEQQAKVPNELMKQVVDEYILRTDPNSLYNNPDNIYKSPEYLKYKQEQLNQQNTVPTGRRSRKTTPTKPKTQSQPNVPMNTDTTPIDQSTINDPKPTQIKEEISNLGTASTNTGVNLNNIPNTELLSSTSNQTGENKLPALSGSNSELNHRVLPVLKGGDIVDYLQVPQHMGTGLNEINLDGPFNFNPINTTGGNVTETKSPNTPKINTKHPLSYLLSKYPAFNIANEYLAKESNNKTLKDFGKINKDARSMGMLQGFGVYTPRHKYSVNDMIDKGLYGKSKDKNIGYSF